MGNGLSTWVSAQCKGVLDEPGLVERMRDEKFDVMIVENIDVCGAGEIILLPSNHFHPHAFYQGKT